MNSLYDWPIHIYKTPNYLRHGEKVFKYKIGIKARFKDLRVTAEIVAIGAVGNIGSWAGCAKGSVMVTLYSCIMLTIGGESREGVDIAGLLNISPGLSSRESSAI